MNLDYEFSVGGKKYSVRELLEIDSTDLSNEFATQAARYGYFAVLTVQAEEIWLVAKREREQEESIAFGEYKSNEEYIPVGGRTVSDALANSLLKADETCVKARDTEIQAQVEYHLMRDLAKAFEQRANMLQSMGSHARHEAQMDGMHTAENPSDRLRRRKKG